ncbi:MAG: ATP-binding protein, partial [Aquificota bacterium]
LAPSHLKKQGTHYDLAIAIGILSLSTGIHAGEDMVFLGELSLDGKINRVKGVLPIVISLHQKGYKKFIVPKANAKEACVVKGVEVYGFENLLELVKFLSGELKKEPESFEIQDWQSYDYDVDFSEVYGQHQAKRAAEIACAGMHHLLLIGSPGAGKSMIAKRLPTIMPPLSFEEAVEISRIYSVAGLLNDDFPLITKRPFRSPHYTASDVALAGGGTNPQPGEISLAHLGILFLDEFPEFSRKAIETLRQPMEDGYITISRSGGRATFPAKFLLVAAMNPCPCGNYGNPYKACTCTPMQIKSYQSRISGPILDRIDLRVWVEPLDKESMITMKPGESSQKIRERVIRAVQIQRERFKNSKTKFNGHMTNEEIKRFCVTTEEAQRHLRLAVERLNLTGRGYTKLLKVARTIADLEGQEKINSTHVAEALQFRVEDKTL